MLDFKTMTEAERVEAIHRNAVEHGWFDTDRSKEDIFVMMHSEISEAVEEYRCGRPMVWFKSIITGEPETDMAKWNGEKLEGILTELADLVIRIYDWCGKVGEEPGGVHIPENRLGDFATVCSDLHANLVYELDKGTGFYICYAIAIVDAYCKKNGFEMWDIVSWKHEYNKGRPYRHGNKKM